jgi:hypothetical protein
VRLRTRISILEKERGKLTKAIDVAADTANRSQSRFKAYQGPPPDKESGMLLSLKKLVREAREEN